jgi:hypothetical protein
MKNLLLRTCENGFAKKRIRGKREMKRREFICASICSATALSTSVFGAGEPSKAEEGIYPMLKYGFISAEKREKTVSVQALSTHLEYLYEYGYKTCYVDELQSAKQKSQKKNMALLFSMPDITITNYVLPLLIEYQMKATLVVSPVHIGKSLFVNGVNYPMLGYDELIQLAQSTYFRIAVLGDENPFSEIKTNLSVLHIHQQNINISSYQENDIMNFIRSDSLSLNTIGLKGERMENLIELSLFKAYLKGV